MYAFMEAHAAKTTQERMTILSIHGGVLSELLRNPVLNQAFSGCLYGCQRDINRRKCSWNLARFRFSMLYFLDMQYAKYQKQGIQQYCQITQAWPRSVWPKAGRHISSMKCIHLAAFCALKSFWHVREPVRIQGAHLCFSFATKSLPPPTHGLDDFILLFQFWRETTAGTQKKLFSVH